MSDLEGLRAYDSDGNSSLDSEDAAFGSFAVWKDADSDARVDPGELRSLAEIGLTALALDGYVTGEKLNGKGNVIYATTDAVFADDSTIKVADVLLGYDARDPAPDMNSGRPTNISCRSSFSTSTSFEPQRKGAAELSLRRPRPSHDQRR